MSIILKTAEYELMEKDNILDIFEQVSTYPNIALTNCRTGKFGCIDNVEKWKTQLLQNNGIKFMNRKYDELNNTRFDELLPEDQKSNSELTNTRRYETSSEDIEYPIFIDGFLCTRRHVKKGSLLEAFFNKLPPSQVPKKVIMIDDQKELLEDVAEHMKEMGITFIGLHYKTDEQTLPLNPEVIAYQKQTLVNEKRWISDSDAEKEMHTISAQSN